MIRIATNEVLILEETAIVAEAITQTAELIRENDKRPKGGKKVHVGLGRRILGAFGVRPAISGS